MTTNQFVNDPDHEVDDHLQTDALTDRGPDLEILEHEIVADLFIRNANRLKKAKQLRSRSLWAVVLSIIGFVALILIVRKIRHAHKSNSLVDIHLEPEYFRDAGSKRVMIRYGPFTVPGSGQDMGMKSFKIADAKAPCDACFITWMRAGLEYSDGTIANAENGMWLHHTVLSNTIQSPVKACQKKRGGEKFFASGNERTVLDMTINGTQKNGYRLEKSDKVKLAVELMNELERPQDAILTITYEYIPNAPGGFKALTPIWLDIGDCQGSEVPVPDGAITFEPSSPVWTSTISGRVVTTISHLHDGGIHLHTTRNGETVCTSTCVYSRGMTHAKEAMPRMGSEHISFMSPCNNHGKIRIGEEWGVNAHYDFGEHHPMLDGHGNMDAVMGIAIMYVAEDR